ncbi:MAG: SRPBCC family protein [Thermoanaerobaculia bacterium]|nr:SRPBCC family protein [Thermoanaerobaculia bacterium]
MKITEEVSIEAPVDEVFAVFTDLDSAQRNVTGITAIEVLEGPPRLAVGTRWRETRPFFGKEATEEMWVTALDEKRRYVVEAESHGTKYRTEYIFASGDGSTRVEMTFEGRPVSPSAKLTSGLAFLFRGSLRKALRRDLRDLKAVCESD